MADGQVDLRFAAELLCEDTPYGLAEEIQQLLDGRTVAVQVSDGHEYVLSVENVGAVHLGDGPVDGRSVGQVVQEEGDAIERAGLRHPVVHAHRPEAWLLEAYAPDGGLVGFTRLGPPPTGGPWIESARLLGELRVPAGGFVLLARLDEAEPREAPTPPADAAGGPGSRVERLAEGRGPDAAVVSELGLNPHAWARRFAQVIAGGRTLREDFAVMAGWFETALEAGRASAAPPQAGARIEHSDLNRLAARAGEMMVDGSLAERAEPRCLRMEAGRAADTFLRLGEQEWVASGLGFDGAHDRAERATLLDAFHETKTMDGLKPVMRSVARAQVAHALTVGLAMGLAWHDEQMIHVGAARALRELAGQVRQRDSALGARLEAIAEQVRDLPMLVPAAGGVTAEAPVGGALPQPPAPVAIALGSIARHAQEALGADGHPFDRIAIQGALETPGVFEYLAELDERALLPVPRS